MKPFGYPALIFFLLCFLAAQSARLHAQTQDAAAPSQKVGHVIQISVDALGGKYLEEFLAEAPVEFPNFNSLVTEGAYTLNARFSVRHTLPRRAHHL